MRTSKKLIRHVAAGILCLSMCASLVLYPTYADPMDEFVKANEEIDALKEQMDATSSELSEAEEQRNAIQSDRERLEAEIEEYQNQVDELDMQIMNLQDAIDIAQMEFDDMMLAYTNRIRAIEEYGTSSYWAILFQATSLTDLLGRLDYVKELMNADEQAMALIDTEIDIMGSQQENLEALRNDRKYAATQLKYAQNELDKKLQERIKQISSLNNITADQQAELERLEAEAKMLRAIAADDATYKAETADTIYQKYIVEPGLDIKYPKGSEAVRLALRWLGGRYVWGGEAPQEGGFDCSGLMYYVYCTQLGYDIQRVGGPQYYNDGVFIKEIEDLHPGDMIFFVNTYKKGVSHVGMYISNGVFVHAANQRAGIKVSSIYNEYFAVRYCGAKRIVDEFDPAPEIILDDMVSQP